VRGSLPQELAPVYESIPPDYKSIKQACRACERVNSRLVGKSKKWRLVPTSAVTALIGTLLTRRAPDEDWRDNTVQNALRRAENVWHFIQRRPVLVTLAIVIGLASAFLLWLTIENAYLDYWYLPKGKSVDPGLYIYPELRYTIFDVVLFFWCLVGLICSASSLRTAKHGCISKLAQRTFTLYFILLGVLILGGISMMVARSHGY
jgi:hypothetical protein